jgi:pantoate--beta-alanine ligase
MRPDVLERIDHVREWLAPARARHRRIGLVPTMGALHAGHTRLIETARAGCDVVVVTIFVNPLQFDRADDLEKYPRTLDADLALCASLDVDAVFAPPASDMYPSPPMCTVQVGRIADHLCGAHRPGHFNGVATVVLKLLEIARPDRAYFGEKDAQQLAIVRRLAADFNLAVEIVGVPTVREPDGLALSSRNQRMDPAERQLAVSLYRALTAAGRQIAEGDTDPARVTRDASMTIPADDRLELEYLEIVDPDDMQPLSVIAGPALVAGALWVGSTRLIDNILSRPLDAARDKPSDPARSGPRVRP